LHFFFFLDGVSVLDKAIDFHAQNNALHSSSLGLLTCHSIEKRNRMSLQFHQRFTRAFFVRKLRFGSFSSYVLALAPKFRTKKTRKNVDEIDKRLQPVWMNCLLFSSFRMELRYKRPSLFAVVESFGFDNPRIVKSAKTAKPRITREKSLYLFKISRKMLDSAFAGHYYLGNVITPANNKGFLYYFLLNSA